MLRPTTIATGSVPEITWHRSGTARYQVQVHDAQGPFVLALGDAYSRDWHVHGLPAGAKAVPIEIDGYRNGWAIDARGDMKLTVEYTPARVKEAVVGYGKAEKSQMQEMVRIILDLNHTPEPDDAADALAIALCHVQHAAFAERVADST